METIIQQQTDLNLRAATVSDLDYIISLYQQNETFETEINSNSRFTNDFGLPLYVAEFKNKIIGYSYTTATNSGEYNLKTHFETSFSNHPIKEILMDESNIHLEKEWKNNSNKNLAVAIAQLVNWLNNSNF